MYWQYWLADRKQTTLATVQAMTRHEFDGWFVFYEVAAKRKRDGAPEWPNAE